MRKLLVILFLFSSLVAGAQTRTYYASQSVDSDKKFPSVQFCGANGSTLTINKWTAMPSINPQATQAFSMTVYFARMSSPNTGGTPGAFWVVPADTANISLTDPKPIWFATAPTAGSFYGIISFDYIYSPVLNNPAFSANKAELPGPMVLHSANECVMFQVLSLTFPDPGTEAYFAHNITYSVTTP